MRARFPRAEIAAMASAIILAFALQAAPAVAQDSVPVAAAAKPVQPSLTPIVAHRGGALARPENSMAAFRHALSLGSEWLELDLMMTADNRLAITHDAKVNDDFCAAPPGFAPASTEVRHLTLAQLQAYDCGSRVRPQYQGDKFVAVADERVPELIEMLGEFRDSDAKFFIETKIPKGSAGSSDVDPVLFASLLEAAVRAHGLEDRVILQSFDYRTIDAMHRINPRIRTCLLGAPRFTRDYLGKLREHHADCIVLSDRDIDAAGVKSLQNAGIILFSGVVDSEAEWQRYLDLGFNTLFTNDPEGALRFRSKVQEPR